MTGVQTCALPIFLASRRHRADIPAVFLRQARVPKCHHADVLPRQMGFDRRFGKRHGYTVRPAAGPPFPLCLQRQNCTHKANRHHHRSHCILRQHTDNRYSTEMNVKRNVQYHREEESPRIPWIGRGFHRIYLKTMQSSSIRLLRG